MRRGARQPEIGGVRIEEGAVHGAAAGEQTARTGFRAADDEDFGIGNGIAADLQRFSHIDRDRAGHHHAVGMAGRSGEADAVTSQVEIDVARGVEFHFDRCVAPGADLAQLERAAEVAADFGAYGRGVEPHAFVAGPHDESFARRRADAVVVREADIARRRAGAFAAEETAAEVERERRGGQRPGGADCRCPFEVRGVRGFGQFGPSAELFGQFDGVEIGNVLFPVAAQYFYFR